VYEEQIHAYLTTFQIPEDYQRRILEAHRRLQEGYADAAERRGRLETQLCRAGELYEWGDYKREEYAARREQLGREMR
jgi:hypothetical protein